MKYLIFTSKKKIKFVLVNEILRHRLLVLRRFYSSGSNYNAFLLFKIQYLLSKLKFTNRLRVRCALHNYPKTFRTFRLSRFALKSEIGKGNIVGVKKSSW